MIHLGFLLLGTLFAGALSLATVNVVAAETPPTYPVFTENAVYESIPDVGAHNWRAKSGASQSGGYLYAPKPVNDQVTVTSRLRFDPEAGTQRILLAGLAREMQGPPSLLALNLSVKPGWIGPLISLSIEGNAGFFPGHLKTEPIETSHGTVNALTLTNNLKLTSDELEATLSVDLDTGLVSVSLREPNAGAAYFEGQLYLNPIKGPVYAGMGGFCDDSIDAWFLRADSFTVSPASKRLGLPLAISQNAWVGLTAYDDPNPYAGNKSIYMYDNLAAWVMGIGPGLPGTFRLIANSADDIEKEIWQGQIKPTDEKLLITGGLLPAGRYQIRLEYLEPGYRVTVAETTADLVAIKAEVPLAVSGEEGTRVSVSPIEIDGYTLRIEDALGGNAKPIRVEQLPYGQSMELQVRPTNLIVEPGQVIGSISPLLIGGNVVYHLDKDAYWRSDLLPTALRNLKIGFLRYPGGSITSTYHWQKPTGRTWNEDPWSPTFDGYYEPITEWMSFDEYMAIVKETGATPLVGINISSGHKFNRVEDGVAEAQAFVRYAKEKGYNVKHWFIDNEPYLPQSYVTLTPEEYAHYINLYSKAIREIDPEIKIVINWRQQWEPAWETILKLAGPSIDYLDLHSYWSWGTVTFSRWAEAPMSRAVKLTYEDTIRLFKGAIQRYGLDIKVGFFEWNIGPSENGAKYVSPYQAGIINAETFMQFIRGGADAAAFWPLHYDGQWSARSLVSRGDLNSGKLKTLPVYDVFSLYSSVLGDNLIYSQSDQQRTLAFAALSQKEDRLTVYLLRKDAQYTPVSLSLGDFGKEAGLANATIEVLSYTAPAGNLAATDAWVRDLPWQLGADGRIELAVEPYSLTKVEVKLGTNR